NTAGIGHAIAEGRIDVAFVEGVVDDPGIVATPWREEPLQVVVAAGATLGAKRHASVAELSRQPWLLREAGSGTRQVARRLLRQRGIRPARLIEVGSNEAIARAAAEGAGVALLPAIVVRDLVAMGRVRVVGLAGDPDILRPLYRLELANRPRGPALQAFVDMVEGKQAPLPSPPRKPRAPGSAPPPAAPGGRWEGVVTARADPKDTPPQPSPAFAGEGARSSRLPPLLQDLPRPPEAGAQKNPAACAAGFGTRERDRVGRLPDRLELELLAGLGGALDGFLGLGLDRGAGRLDLGLGDLGDGFVGLQGTAEHFLAGADAALDVLARNLQALRPRGLQAVEIAGLGDLAPEGEGSVGVLSERG